MTKYVCDLCGYVYDPAEGDPDNGVPPGTAWEDVPDDWVCPLCGAGKEDLSVMADYSYCSSRGTKGCFGSGCGNRLRGRAGLARQQSLTGDNIPSGEQAAPGACHRAPTPAGSTLQPTG